MVAGKVVVDMPADRTVAGKAAVGMPADKTVAGTAVDDRVVAELAVTVIVAELAVIVIVALMPVSDVYHKKDKKPNLFGWVIHNTCKKKLKRQVGCAVPH